MTAEHREEGLGVKATRGVFWVGGGQFTRQLVQMVTTIVLARLLVPEDFGLISMAIVFVGISQLFADFGIGAAIVQSKQTPDIALSSSFWLNVAIGIVLVILIWILAPFIAEFYGEERVRTLVMVLALTLPLSTIMVVPTSILYKELRFQDVVRSQVYGSLTGAALAIILAWMGFGVWSLVIQPIVGLMITAILVFKYSGWYPHVSYSWSSVKGLVNFSLPVLGSDLMNYAYRNGDSLIIGRVLGSQQLGYYSLAYQIMLYPMTQISSVVVKVMFPTLSKMQDDLERLASAYLRSVGAIAMITFPMMAGLYMVADDFVMIVFGEKWMPMSDVLQILCWVGLMQSVSTTVGTVYLSTGNTRVAFYVTLFATPLYLVSFLIGVQWGITGVAFAYVLSMAVVTVVNFRIGFRIIGADLGKLFGTLLPSLLSSMIMMAAVWFVQEQLLHSSVALRFTISVITGILVYVLSTFLFNRERLREILDIGRSAMTRN